MFRQMKKEVAREAERGDVLVLDCSSREAVEALYETMARPALNKTRSLIEDAEAAKEIVHEVFVRLWEKAPIFPDPKAAYSWIYKSCHNAAIDLLRSAAHKREEAGLQIVDETADQSELRIDDKVIHRAEWLRFMRMLSEEEAQVLAYTVLDDMSQDEISDLMEISRRTVQRLWKSALEIIRRNS